MSFGIQEEIAEVRANLKEWKVFNMAAYWDFERTAIAVAYVGYEQKLVIKEIKYYPHCELQNFPVLVKSTWVEMYKGRKNDEFCNRIALTDNKFVWKSVVNYMTNYRPYRIDNESLQSSEELLKILHKSKKLILPKDFKISRLENKNILLLLTSIFGERLTSPPVPRGRYLTIQGYHYKFTVNRLPGDPDYREESPSYWRIWKYW